MAAFRLETNRIYKAEISLGFFEKLASNDTIKDRLTQAGFINVCVTGSGGKRCATGVWTGSSMMCELPSQISNVTIMT